MNSTAANKVPKTLVSKLLRPIIVLGLLTGATAGTLATGTATASASPAPSIFVQHASLDSHGVLQVQVAGSGYTPGGQVWIGIASDDWNPSIHKFSWDYKWGTWVTASPRGFYPNPGGRVSATITITNACNGEWRFGLAASDATSGAVKSPRLAPNNTELGG